MACGSQGVDETFPGEVRLYEVRRLDVSPVSTYEMGLLHLLPCTAPPYCLDFSTVDVAEERLLLVGMGEHKVSCTCIPSY